ncbi:MAG: HAMP domain-containing histidine kinase [Clostridia bacterium]|nr:HAMP domain-containing histidine kinase [Clostridia bacterium]
MKRKLRDNSIFSKYLTTFLVLMLVAFLLLGVTMTFLISRYTLAEKEQSMQTALESVSDFVRYAAHQPKTEANLRALRTLMDLYGENVKGMVFFADGEGCITLYSREAEEVLGLREGSPVCLSSSVLEQVQHGKAFRTMGNLGGLLQERHAILWRPVITNDNVVYGTVFVAARPNAMVLELLGDVGGLFIVAGLAVFILSVLILYAISAGITQPLKQMSRAAKAFSDGRFDVRVPENGDDEVAELAVAFNRMASSLAEAEETQRGFIANVSHDLKTPMTTIGGFIDGILDGTIPPQRRDEYLQLVSLEVKRLSKLVVSLLDIARMQAGERRFVQSEFDICELLRRVVLSFEGGLNDKNMNLEFDCPDEEITVRSDFDAIYQVFFNLFDNALKFSPSGGTITVGIAIVGKKVWVRLRNTGQGIPESELPHVFDRFYKTDRSRGIDKTGVGLGLYICRTIIGSLGEQIRVQSEYGEYCEFTFSLPYAE